jgi:hypothetical protein
VNAAALARALKAKRTKAGWSANCPAHDDRTASLSIGEGENGRLLLKCFAGCTFDAILKAAGVEPTKPNGADHTKPLIVATYDYHDATGKLAFQVVRYAPKDFRQRRPNGSGWEWNMKGVDRVPYRLPELLSASEVYICEGEKDADRLATLGLAATTNPGGAGKWPDGFERWFDGRHAIILPDNDQPGRDHAQDVARKLKGHAASLRIIDLPTLPPKGDVSDWITAGGTIEELEDLAQATPSWAEDDTFDQVDGPQQGELPVIESVDVQAFIDMKITPRRFVVEPWLREKGLAMIHAKAGVGKTWFGLSCAYAIATGTAFLKWSAPSPLRVLYLDGEMAAEDVQERLKVICTRPPDPDYFKIVSFDIYDGPVVNLATEDGQARLAAVIDQADAVFVDNLSSMTFDDGRTDAESWETVQSWLLSLRRKGKSVVLFHHSGKSGTQRGTSRRADALDAIIKLERPADATGADGCRFTITFEKARGQLGKAGEPFEAMLTDGIWSMQDEDLSKLMAIADLTLEGKSIRKIAVELGLPQTTVFRLQKQARERGLC